MTISDMFWSFRRDHDHDQVVHKLKNLTTTLSMTMTMILVDALNDMTMTMIR